MAAPRVWRPNKSFEERNRTMGDSMTGPGSASGRVASASPTPKGYRATADQQASGAWYVVSNGLAPAIASPGMTPAWLDLDDTC